MAVVFIRGRTTDPTLAVQPRTIVRELPCKLPHRLYLSVAILIPARITFLAWLEMGSYQARRDAKGCMGKECTVDWNGF